MNDRNHKCKPKMIILIALIALTLVGCQKKNTAPSNDMAYSPPIASDHFSKEDLIYFVLIDRFKDGDPTSNTFDDYSQDPTDLKHYLGGDLQGVIDKLDYIQGLGATALWLSPVVDNEPFGYHGYWTKDFYAVNPHFGDLDLLKDLVDQAHDRNIKVILDYVVNHTGYNHPWLSDDDKADWFHNLGTLTDFNDPYQLENYNLSGLPDLNTENPLVRQYFFDNVLWWIDQTGVDGLRLDTVRHVPKEFWNEFAHVIKSKHADFYLLGEVWNTSAAYLESYHQIGFDGLTNYSLYNGIEETFKLYGDANQLKIALRQEVEFSHPYLNGTFLDNHDVKRMASRSSKYGQDYLKQGLTFIMTYPSIPIIYYGTEIGLEGKDDPLNRTMMTFDDLESNDVYNHYQGLLDLRGQMKDHHDFEVISVAKDYIGILYEKPNENIVTLFNISKRKQSLTLGLNGTYQNYFTGQVYTLTSETPLELQALESMVLKQIKP